MKKKEEEEERKKERTSWVPSMYLVPIKLELIVFNEFYPNLVLPSLPQRFFMCFSLLFSIN